MLDLWRIPESQNGLVWKNLKVHLIEGRDTSHWGLFQTPSSLALSTLRDGEGVWVVKINPVSSCVCRLALGQELQEAKGAVGAGRRRLAEQSAVRTGSLHPILCSS